MVKTVSKLFRKLIRVISDKNVPKSVRFIKCQVKFPIFYAKSGYCRYLMAVTNPLICAQDY
jgi:hypothetical protein